MMQAQTFSTILVPGAPWPVLTTEKAPRKKLTAEQRLAKERGPKPGCGKYAVLQYLIDRNKPASVSEIADYLTALLCQFWRLSLIHISEPTRPY